MRMLGVQDTKDCLDRVLVMAAEALRVWRSRPAPRG